MKLQIFVKKTIDYKFKELYIASLLYLKCDIYSNINEEYDVLCFYGETEEEAIEKLKQGCISQLEKQNIKILEVEV